MMAQIQQEDRYNFGARKFSMWLFIFTSFMLFAAFSSAFIVYSGGKGHGLDVIMPQPFKYSTILIVLSSLTLFLASRAAKGLDFDKQRLFLWATLALGLVFLAFQVYGCYVLTFKMGVFFTNPNASRTFIYVFVGAHLLHILAAILLLLNTIYSTYRKTPQVMNLYKMEMTSIFWHFLDIIWIYLYVFLLLNQY
ncbi:cytochrome c oxidase subunit 3 [Mucilaginibacter sp.]|uniref:cytochrome c oxidase subunit 3 n=1 Tax=Mucilaginibacter sp. TaxID=1882438 RepID=UPI003D105EC2